MQTLAPAFSHKGLFYWLVALLPDNTPHTLANGYLFGVPVRDLGLFATVLMGLTTGFLVFFLGTFFGIVGLMIYNGTGHHTADYSWSYSRVGLPAGILAAVVALGYLLSMWVKRIARRA